MATSQSLKQHPQAEVQSSEKPSAPVQNIPRASAHLTLCRSSTRPGITIAGVGPCAGKQTSSKAFLKEDGSKVKTKPLEQYGSYAAFSDISLLVLLRTLFASSDRADPGISSWARIDEVHGTLQRAAQDKSRAAEQRAFLQQMFAIARRTQSGRSGTQYFSFAEFFEGLTPDLNVQARERMLAEAELIFQNRNEIFGERGITRLSHQYSDQALALGTCTNESMDRIGSQLPVLAVERFLEYRELFNSIAGGRTTLPRDEFLRAFDYCVEDPTDLVRLLDDEFSEGRDELSLDDFLAVILPVHRRGNNDPEK